MLSITLRQLEYALAAADHASFSRAAAALNISQPSITMAIAQLESHYGSPLFLRRKGQGVSLTSFGRGFIEQARRIAAQAKVIEALGGTAGDAAGEVILSCYVHLAPSYLPRLVRKLAEVHPRISVRFRERNLVELIDELENGTIDCALTFDLGLGEGFARDTIAEVRPYALVGIAHPLARRKSIRLREMAGYPLILSDQSLSWQHTVGLFEAAHCSAKIGARVASFELQRSLVANGFGVAVVYIRPVSHVGYDGQELATLEILDRLPQQRIVLARPAKMELTGALRALRELVLARDLSPSS